jgi:hypothetical protein
MSGETDHALDVLAAELDRIEAMDGSPARSAAIKSLAPLVRLADRLTGIRRDEVLRLRAEELLSLGKTADRVGISKGRADQIERDERKKQEARDGHGVHDGAG